MRQLFNPEYDYVYRTFQQQNSKKRCHYARWDAEPQLLLDTVFHSINGTM